jgi:hypothetical protein
MIFSDHPIALIWMTGIFTLVIYPILIRLSWIFIGISAQDFRDTVYTSCLFLLIMMWIFYVITLLSALMTLLKDALSMKHSLVMIGILILHAGHIIYRQVIKQKKRLL